MARSMSPCPTCGFHKAERVKFCAECGAKLPGPSTGAGDVRRTVTVLFADVSGSTALGEPLDPESLRALMGLYFATNSRSTRVCVAPDTLKVSSRTPMAQRDIDRPEPS